MADLIQSNGYQAVAVGTFLEGETILILAGATASLGHLSMPVVIVVATMASFAGDQLYFHLGRSYGAKVLARFPSFQSRTARASVLLEHHHVLVILSIRFHYGLRIAGPITIGMGGIPWSRFLALNLARAIVWAGAVGAVGYWGGQAFAPWVAAFDADEACGLAAILLCAVIWSLVLRSRSARMRRKGRTQ